MREVKERERYSNEISKPKVSFGRISWEGSQKCWSPGLEVYLLRGGRCGAVAAVLRGSVAFFG